MYQVQLLIDYINVMFHIAQLILMNTPPMKFILKTAMNITSVNRSNMPEYS